MSQPSILFNTPLARMHEPRAASPSASMAPLKLSSSLSLPNSYWGGDRELASTPFDREGYYSQHKTSLRLPNPPRFADERYEHQSGSPHPPIDLSGLIPMFGERESSDTDSRGQLIDLAYNPWPMSSMPQYSTFQRNTKPSDWQLPPDARLPPHQWGFSFGSGSSLRGNHEYGLYSPHSPPSSSTSSSPPPSAFVSPSSDSGGVFDNPRGRNPDKGAAKKSCFHCHATSTPLWRREPSTQRPLCNACGLYLQQRNKLRPQALIDADADDDDTPQIPDEEYTGPKCSHCLTRQTSVWRRSKTGAQVCNACGVYARLRGKERPLSLRRNKIKPRTKHSR